MISPNVTTFAPASSLTPAPVASVHVIDDAARIHRLELACLTRPRIEQRAADADRDGARANPVAGVLDPDPAGRHQLDLRHRAVHVAQISRAERRRREHLHDVGASLPGREDFGRRKAARHDRHAALHRRLNQRQTTDRTDEKPRAGINHFVGRDRVGHGAGAQNQLRRELRREAANQFNRAWHRHGHFEHTDAAGQKRVDHAHQPRRIFHPDDGDDAAAFNFRYGLSAGRERHGNA